MIIQYLVQWLGPCDCCDMIYEPRTSTSDELKILWLVKLLEAREVRAARAACVAGAGSSLPLQVLGHTNTALEFVGKKKVLLSGILVVYILFNY